MGERHLISATYNPKHDCFNCINKRYSSNCSFWGFNTGRYTTLQLRDHVLANLDSRPVILTGDFNSYYHRDDIVTAFIQPIEATGKATVGDAWIEVCRSGVYPAIGAEADAEELLDKIIYVNPVEGAAVKPVSVTIDKAGYMYEGKPMGDHFPLMASFTVEDKSATGIRTIRQSENTQSFDLLGRPAGTTAPKGIRIIDGQKYITE